MNHWDARAEALLTRARVSNQVPAGARGRVRASLAASVALSAVAGASATAVAAPTALAKLPVAVKAASSLLPAAVATIGPSGPILLLAPVTVGVVLGLSAISPSAVTRPIAPATSLASGQVNVPAKVPPRGIAHVTPRQVAVETEQDEIPVGEAVSAKSSGGPSSLTEEAVVLEHARLVLRQGDAELTLRLLDRHRYEFPNGVLFFEASATRAVALCRLGRTDEGTQILDRLEFTTPGSGLIARVRSACRKNGVAE